MKKLKFLLLIVLSLSILLLVGCSDKSLMASDDLIEMVEKAVPCAKLVSVEHKDNHNEFGVNIYTFTNGDFEFVLENYMTQDSVFGWNSNVYHNNYLYKMIEKNYSSIQALASSYDIYLLADSIEKTEFIEAYRTYRTTNEILDLMSENKDKVFIDLRVANVDDYSSGLSFNIYLNNFSQIDNIYDFMKDFHSFLNDYYPTKEYDKLHFDFRYSIEGINSQSTDTYDKTIRIYSDSFVLIDNDYPIELYESDWIKHKFAYQVRLNRISDSVLSYSEALKFNPIEINRLDIEGTIFECSNDFSFVYNIENGRYYCKVYGGNEFANSENIEYVNTTGEGSQRYFLEKIYGDVDYIANKDEKYSSYRINGLTYKILRVKLGKDFEFYRNGKKLKINDVETIPYHNEYDASQYVSLEDFAEIFGLKADKIDRTNGVIYFSKLSK